MNNEKIFSIEANLVSGMVQVIISWFLI